MVNGSVAAEQAESVPSRDAIRIVQMGTAVALAAALWYARGSAFPFLTPAVYALQAALPLLTRTPRSFEVSCWIVASVLLVLGLVGAVLGFFIYWSVVPFPLLAAWASRRPTFARTLLLVSAVLGTGGVVGWILGVIFTDGDLTII